MNILAAMSLALCLATAGVWVRSYWCLDGVAFRTVPRDGSGQKALACLSASGLFMCGREITQYSGKLPPRQDKGWAVLLGDNPENLGAILLAFGSRYFSFLGFGYGRAHSAANFTSGGLVTDQSLIIIPDWFICLLLAIAPARWLVLKRREIRNGPHHLCKTCGYDLRATADADGPLLERCPECGMEAPAIVTLHEPA